MPDDNLLRKLESSQVVSLAAVLFSRCHGVSRGKTASHAGCVTLEKTG